MTMTAKPISHFLAAALLLLSAVLAALNWYFRPAQAGAWAMAIAFIGCMTVAFFFASRPTDNETQRRAADAIRHAIVFAGLIMAIPLGMSVAVGLGVIHDADLSKRITMAIIGVSVAFTGNALPKTLTPLSRLQCDPAKVQAFQRLAGWTWVLTGLGYSLVWLVMPLDLANPVSMVLLMSGMLVVAVQLLRLRRTRAAH